jgi:EAL domain-containing protein (putative c-di-GMP-specific phosphodiesterase class I)
MGRLGGLALALARVLGVLRLKRGGVVRRARAGSEEAEAWPPSEGALLRALKDGEIVVDFRPVVAVDGGALVAIESTLRWERPSGPVREQRLIAAVERHGQTRIQHALVEAQLREAARVLTAARAGRHPELRVSVPLTRSQFGDPALASVLRGALDESGAPAEALEIGVEERAVASDLAGAASVIAALRGQGVRVSLRGYGSLDAEQVQRLGVTEVTVDFWGSVRDRGTEDFVKDTVRSAHELGLTVTATGAETPEEVVLVKELGCERVQGDAFGTPRRASAFTRGSGTGSRAA